MGNKQRVQQERKRQNIKNLWTTTSHVTLVQLSNQQHQGVQRTRKSDH